MNQRIVIASLVLMNVVVYGALSYGMLVIRPEQERARTWPSAVAVLQTVAAISPTALPTSTVKPTATLVLAEPSATPPDTPGSPTPPLTVSPSPTPTVLRQMAFVAPRYVPTAKRASPTLVRPTSTATATASNNGLGTSQGYALMADGSSQTLAPGASVWYKIGNGGVHMDVFLEAKSLGGLGFEVYAPENPGRAIGAGSLENSTGRLVWAGGRWNASGDWTARVWNNNAMPVNYQMTSLTRVIGQCETTSYWEYIHGSLVYWTRCK